MVQSSSLGHSPFHFDGLGKFGHGARMTIIHCEKPGCEWIRLERLTGLQDVPHLLPNPDLSGIGVILGFSITAYLTLILLVTHYITVYDFHQQDANGKGFFNPVDRGILTFLRSFKAWTPTRRFEYAMEKSVLILSDAQLVTGLAILVSGYSQLKCGISAYHWAILIYIAWFSSFTFLSALVFLQGYFDMNHSLRVIRVFFMFILASMLLVALLPTGSRNWLDLVDEGGGFYPSLSTLCYFQQMRLDTFTHGGPRIWSMIVSILVAGISYIHGGIKLFDPSSCFCRKYYRTLPGNRAKQCLHFLDKKSRPRGLRSTIWKLLYHLIFAAFAGARALFDVLESMLFEILWLVFAIAWGTIKLYDTRASAGYNVQGEYVGANGDVLEEDFWSFGQTLSLVLLLLPLLSMAQAYLDHDAKAQQTNYETTIADRQVKQKRCSTAALQPPMSSVDSQQVKQERSTTTISQAYIHNLDDTENALPPSSQPLTSTPILPCPNSPFTSYPWYKDHMLLLLLQLFIVAAFSLFLLNALSNFLGITFFLRSRLFLIWIPGLIPAASFLHLLFWYLGAWVARMFGWQRWLLGLGDGAGDGDEEGRRGEAGTDAEDVHGEGDRARNRGLGKMRRRSGPIVYWILRMGLIVALLAFTLMVSLEAAGPEALDLSIVRSRY